MMSILIKIESRKSHDERICGKMLKNNIIIKKKNESKKRSQIVIQMQDFSYKLKKMYKANMECYIC